jgi:beta-lactamase regulating signal transducer with metallopeptidase domain
MLAWMAQSCVFVSIAALLPLLFRIRHPETRVAYGHAVIVVCMLLPLLQPWKHDRAVRQFAERSTASVSPSEATRGRRQASAPISRTPLKAEPGAGLNTLPPDRDSIVVNVRQGRWFLLILGSGALLRLIWLLGGLWRIRSYRISATPLYPVPETLRAASAITHADALFCLSENAPGPVMVGWLAPVILLPESFLGLSEESQCGVGCHELLHVRRNDWLITLIEEFAAALMWFNPGIWLLLSQTRLAREQLVDAESVRLTGAREPYIEALMTVARTRILDLAPAPLFLRRRHLSQRMHALLSEVSVSKFRIVGSCFSMGAILACTAWLMCLSFPLMGRPATLGTEDLDAPAAGQDTGAVATPSAAPAAQMVRRQALPTSSAVAPALSSALLSPIPPDPHELVVGVVQPAAAPVDRAAALNLLERARQNGLTHNQDMQPFHFTAQFTASGNAAGSASGNTGPGELTEIWMNGQKWRWTASLGSSSVIRISHQGQLLENSHVTAIPMRAHMLRNEIFWATEGYAARTQLRTAQVQWNGKLASCILASPVAEAAAATQGRLWQEEEFCIDNNSGLLLVHSIAPGTFAVFGYDSNQQFHGRTMPDRITIYVNGSTVADSSFSITDTVPQDEASVTPGAEMTRNPPVVQVQMPAKMSSTVPAAASAAGTVLVHAQADGDGNVTDAELSSTSDPALTQAALGIVRATRFGYTGAQRQFYLSVSFGQQ